MPKKTPVKKGTPVPKWKEPAPVKKVLAKKPPRWKLVLPRYHQPHEWSNVGKSPATGRRLKTWKLAPPDEKSVTLDCLRNADTFSYEGRLALLSHADWLLRQDEHNENEALIDSLLRSEVVKLRHSIEVERTKSDPLMFHNTVAAAMTNFSRLSREAKRYVTISAYVPVFDAHLGEGSLLCRANLIDSIVNLTRLVESLTSATYVNTHLSAFSDEASPYVIHGLLNQTNSVIKNTQTLIYEAFAKVFVAAWACYCGAHPKDDLDDRESALIDAITQPSPRETMLSHADALLETEPCSTNAQMRAALVKYQTILRYLRESGNTSYDKYMTLCVDALMAGGGALSVNKKSGNDMTKIDDSDD